MTCNVEQCEISKNIVKGFCPKHYQRWYRHGDPLKVNRDGPVPKDNLVGWLDGNGYVCIRVNGKKKMQHRYVMEKALGRELLPNENVHHLNGVKNDNRIDNLELWVKSQPPGQRPRDLVKWARQVLDLYEEEVDSHPGLV